MKDHKTCVLILYLFRRVRYESHTEVVNHREIYLEPFEFLFGRDSVTELTGLTPDEVRYRMGHFATSKLLSKIPSKTTSRYTVYRWMWEHFCEVSPQQNPQQNPQQLPQHSAGSAPTNKNETIKEEDTKKTNDSSLFKEKGEEQPASPETLVSPTAMSGLFERLETIQSFRYQTGAWENKPIEKKDLDAWAAMTRDNPDDLVKALEYFKRQEKQAIRKGRPYDRPPAVLNKFIYERTWENDKSQGKIIKIKEA